MNVRWLALLLLPLPVLAAPSRTDMIEHIFGVTAIHAITGHGRLTIGVAKDGDLTTLVWPNPSYNDQLAFLSSNAVDARQQPRFGALPGSGLYLGLELADKTVVWLHDLAATQTYAQDGSAIETTFTGKGMEVLVIDAVHPTTDVLVRMVQVKKGQAVALRTYANLSPLPPTSRLPELPLADWGLDGRNDFAAVWDAKVQAIVHFHPQDRRIYAAITDLLVPPEEDFGPIGKALAANKPADALALDLDKTYAPGAYAVLTTMPPPSQHHIGYDRADFCSLVGQLIANAKALPTTFPGFTLPMDPAVLDQLGCKEGETWPDVQLGWQHHAISAYEAVTQTTLPGNDVAAGEVDEALVTPLQDGHATVVLAFGPTAEQARTGLAHAAETVQASHEALAAWLKTVRLPQKASPAVLAVARQALINLRVGTVADTGSVVASIARQPPYGLDWPRDGAFFALAMDVSGQTKLADKRMDLLASFQRDKPVKPTPLIDPPPAVDPRTGKSDEFPAGAWEMNYYADGKVGGNLRFEIDNTAFALWSLCAHPAWTADPKAALDKHWSTIVAAADLLAAWKDDKTGLQAPAQEDDNAAPTQTLHGAVTVQGALALAAKVAKKYGHLDEGTRWQKRADELTTAIRQHLFDAKAGLFVQAPNATSNPGSAGSGPTAWLVWPMRVLPWTAPEVEKQLVADWAAIQPAIAGTSQDGGAYFLKNLVATAIARGQDKVWRPKLVTALAQVAAQATDTHHFGEVMVLQDGKPDQRVATPHLWEGTLFYLTAMALEDPAALQKENPPPVVKVPEAKKDEGCQAGRRGPVTWLGLLLVALALSSRKSIDRRRRRD